MIQNGCRNCSTCQGRAGRGRPGSNDLFQLDPNGGLLWWHRPVRRGRNTALHDIAYQVHPARPLSISSTAGAHPGRTGPGRCATPSCHPCTSVMLAQRGDWRRWPNGKSLGRTRSSNCDATMSGRGRIGLAQMNFINATTSACPTKTLAIAVAHAIPQYLFCPLPPDHQDPGRAEA